jgi:hypothetical protein
MKRFVVARQRRALLAEALLAAAAVALASCGPTVTDLGSSNGQPPPSDAQSPPQGGPVSETFAWKGSDGAFLALEPVDPDALVLSLTNVDQSCGFVMPEPRLDDACVPEDQWQLLFAIPPELDRPGLIDLGDPRIQFASVTRVADCLGGGTGVGHAAGGTLEILASDETSVTFELTGAQPGAPSGLFVAARCGAPPPRFVPSPAVAVRGSALPGNPSSGTGPTADPDALYLFFGEVPGTCADPRPTGDCTSNRQMVLGLPPALQSAGEVSLTDPAIDAIYTALENSCSTAAPDAGTITISNVSETAMAVRIYGSGWAAFDGDYAVTICP